MRALRANIAALVLVTALFTGCAGATRLATGTLAAGVGGIAGNVLGKGNPLAIGAGALQISIFAAPA